MPVLAQERAAEVLANWRLGLDDKGLDNPAGPLFRSDYAESEITMTGDQTFVWETCDFSQGGDICCWH
jgi:hypothetical protein